MPRSCEECLAIRAKVSPPRQRLQVRPAGPPIPSRLKELRELLTYPFPEPVWARLGHRALDNGEPHEIAEAIKTLERVKAEHLASLARRRAAYAKFFPSKA